MMTNDKITEEGRILRNAEARQRNANKTPEQRETRRQYEKARYAASEEVRRKQREASLRYLAKHPYEHVRDSYRGYWLKNRYGMTVEEYESKFNAQGRKCPICDALESCSQRRFPIDHNHDCCDSMKSCGKCRRGIICPNCNRRVGFLEELLREGTCTATEGTWLAKALAYLAHYPLDTAA